MTERRQEKIGWIGGWSGGFVWVVILSIVLLIRGQSSGAMLGFAIAGVAAVTILLAAPWRHPRVPYRLLMAPIYVLFFVAVGWGVWCWGGPRNLGFANWWSLLMLLPALAPVWLAGNRRWQDGTSPPR